MYSASPIPTPTRPHGTGIMPVLPNKDKLLTEVQYKEKYCLWLCLDERRS